MNKEQSETLTPRNITTINNKLAFNTQELSEALGVSVQTVRRVIKQGKLKSIKVGKSHVVSREAVNAFLTEYEGTHIRTI